MSWKIIPLVLFAVASIHAAALDIAPGLNAVVLQVIETMPHDGGYSASSSANRLLAEAIRPGPRNLVIDAAHAVPSYCSSATYLVLAGVCQQLIRDGRLALDHDTLHALLVSGQRDGEGIWGRWNANGPGTARLFSELGLGRNFLEWSDARPGDFMKIFWNKEIGSREHGHSVIFLGTESENGVDYVRFWSSNIGRGYGEKRVERRKVMLAIFSRLEHPENLSRIAAVPPLDPYLASLLANRSSIGEVRQKCGM